MLKHNERACSSVRLEQYTHNVLVPGSNPGGPTNFIGIQFFQILNGIITGTEKNNSACGGKKKLNF